MKGEVIKHVWQPVFPSLLAERIDKTMATTEKTAKIIGKEDLSHLVAAKAHVALKEADTIIDALMETVREWSLLQAFLPASIEIGFVARKVAPSSAFSRKRANGSAS